MFFQTKLSPYSTNTSRGLKHRIPRQKLPMYSNSEVWRAKSRSKCCVKHFFCHQLAHWVSFAHVFLILKVQNIHPNIRGN